MILGHLIRSPESIACVTVVQFWSVPRCHVTLALGDLWTFEKVLRPILMTCKGDLWQVYVSVTFRIGWRQATTGNTSISAGQRERGQNSTSVTGFRKGSGKGLRARERARGKSGVPSLHLARVNNSSPFHFECLPCRLWGQVQIQPLSSVVLGSPKLALALVNSRQIYPGKLTFPIFSLVCNTNSSNYCILPFECEKTFRKRKENQLQISQLYYTSISTIVCTS